MVLFEGQEPSQYLFEECADLDLSSLYPSIIMALNLSPETFIKKICVTDSNENNIEDKIIDEYISGDYISLGNKYLNLPSIDDLIKEVCMDA